MFAAQPRIESMGAAKPRSVSEHSYSDRGQYTRGMMLRIYLRRLAHKAGERPSHESIVLEARRFGLTGATVIDGAMGYGASEKIHAPHILSIAVDRPVIVEIVDEAERIESFLPVLSALMSGGIAIIQELEMTRRIPPA